MDRPEEEGGSVLSSAKKLLTLYRDPVVARATSASDFSLSDLRQHSSPVTLYLVPTQDNKQRLQPLVRMLITSMLRTSGVRMERIRKQSSAPSWWPFRWPFARSSVRVKAKYKHRLLLMFDEFKSVGKHPILQEAMAHIAGYGITCLIAIQDITQIRSEQTGYGRDEEFTAGCHIKVAYPPNRPETADWISSLLGITTVLREQPTLRPSGFGRSSITLQEVQRPLLTADECMRLPGPTKVAGEESDIVAAGDMVIHVAGFAPIRCKQPLSIFEPIFLQRMALEPAVSDVLRSQVTI
jgi:type IV secretion system protein VirD4